MGGFENGPLAYAEISFKDNAADSLVLPDNTAGDVHIQVTNFDTNGLSNLMTPDHTNDHITVVVDGVYEIHVCIAVANVAAQAHAIHFDLFKNNQATLIPSVHGHRQLSGGAGDIGAIPLCGITRLSAGDTIELWASTDASASREILIDDTTFIISQIGV